MAVNRRIQRLPVMHRERFDGVIDMAVERGSDGIGITLVIDHRKVELEDEIAVMQRRGVLTDLQKLSKNSSLIFQENVLRGRLESGLIGQKPAGSRLHGHIDQRVSFYTGS